MSSAKNWIEFVGDPYATFIIFFRVDVPGGIILREMRDLRDEEMKYETLRKIPEPSPAQELLGIMEKVSPSVLYGLATMKFERFWGKRLGTI